MREHLLFDVSNPRQVFGSRAPAHELEASDFWKRARNVIANEHAHTGHRHLVIEGSCEKYVVERLHQRLRNRALTYELAKDFGRERPLRAIHIVLEDPLVGVYQSVTNRRFAGVYEPARSVGNKRLEQRVLSFAQLREVECSPVAEFGDRYLG